MAKKSSSTTLEALRRNQWTFYASAFLVIFYFWFTKPVLVSTSLSEENR